MKLFNLLYTRRLLIFLCVYVGFLDVNYGQKTFNNDNKILPKARKTPILKGYLNIIPTFNRLSLQTDTSKIFDKRSTISMQPSFSFARMKIKGSFFQVSLTRFRLSNSDNLSEIINPTSSTLIPARGAKTLSFNISTLLEWGIPIAYQPDNKSNFFLGWGIGESISYNSLKPYSSAAFPYKITNLSLNYSVVPSWQYSISEKSFLTVDLPYTFAITSFEHRFYNNPILPTYARRTTDPNLIWTPKDLRLRIGLGVRL